MKNIENRKFSSVHALLWVHTGLSPKVGLLNFTGPNPSATNRHHQYTVCVTHQYTVYDKNFIFANSFLRLYREVGKNLVAQLLSFCALKWFFIYYF